MKVIIEKPLENIFADAMMKGISFYEVCNNHNWHNKWYRNRRENNSYPFVRIDPRQQLWKKTLPEGVDGYDLESRVTERFYDELNEMSDCYDELQGFQITTDINGYRILLSAPISSLEEEREELVERIESYPEHVPYGNDEIDDLKEEIRDIDKELIKCAKAYDYFIKIAESLKHYFDDYVVVVDKEGRYDFVHKEHYEDLKEEYCWELWKEEGEIV